MNRPPRTELTDEDKFFRIGKELRKILPEIESRYGVNRIGYFCEFLDRHGNKTTEVNVIVELQKPMGWKFFELREFIESRLRRRIDIVTPRGLKAMFRADIEKCITYL